MAATISRPTEPMYHFGVGGAGNRAKSTASVSQKIVSDNIYQQDLSYRSFSRGVGGIGNFSKATREQEPADIDVLQLLHDCRAPRKMSANVKYHTGVGGYANIYEPTLSEIQQAQNDSESARRRSLAELARRKDASVTNSSRSSSSSQGSPRSSFADSMRGLFGGRSSDKA
ncbi:hypothetical protein B0A52_02770 [Exophiala mesophila]|uniref:Uncharacterized protein n=1 Tax=Exophiala mesophila TaxID=212818 RepID=A0A438NDU9_EXOME|nr:hypothetical protein B0A52_02770 [Exophiala mesophila]